MSKDHAMEEFERRLAEAGVVTYDDARDWLGFSEEEKAMSDMRIAAARAVEARARAAKVSQRELARRMGTRQPAVSRMLSGAGSPTFETLFRAMLALGADRREIAAALAN